MTATIIHAYTRKQALEDRVLVEVSELAKEAGFKWPVAITCELESVLQEIPAEFSYQDYKGRLWDVLNMAIMAIRCRADGEVLEYSIICHHTVNDANGSIKIKDMLKLRLRVHAGDHGEPVITIDKI